VALLHWAFRMLPDEKNPPNPLDFTKSAMAHPMPFKVDFKPRFASSMDAIAELMEGYGL